jgi:glutamate transport system permease protein
MLSVLGPSTSERAAGVAAVALGSDVDLAARAFGQGFLETLQLAVTSYALALALGAVLAVMHISPASPARWASRAFVEFFRNVPLLLIFFLFGFGLPKVGLDFRPFTWAVIVLATYTAAFICETIRSGVNSVSMGQAEAARAIGLDFIQSLRHVVLPQALRAVVPPLGSLFIALTKNTSLALVVGVQEVSAKPEQLINQNVSTVLVIVGVASCYLAVNLPASYVIGRIEAKAVFAR